MLKLSQQTLLDIVYSIGMEVLPPIPYSADFSLCDFDLIPQLKKLLCRKRFANKEAILTGVGESHTADGNQRLSHRWQRCVEALGDYFEVY